MKLDRSVTTRSARQPTIASIARPFNEHSKVRVVRSDDHGALIVQLNDSRFALSRGMAMKIMVEA